MGFADLTFKKSLRFALVFTLACANVLGHDGTDHSLNSAPLKLQETSPLRVASTTDEFSIDSKANSSCNDHSEPVDCHSCPIHCHLQVASLSTFKDGKEVLILMGLTHFENSRIQLGTVLEPALRPPIF